MGIAAIGAYEYEALDDHTKQQFVVFSYLGLWLGTSGRSHHVNADMLPSSLLFELLGLLARPINSSKPWIGPGWRCHNVSPFPVTFYVRRWCAPFSNCGRFISTSKPPEN